MSDNQQSRGQHTLAEIGSQPDSWEAVPARVDNCLKEIKELFSTAEDVIFTGCGSAFNVANCLAPQCQRVSGKTSRAAHASELMINPQTVINSSRKSLKPCSTALKLTKQLS